MLKIESKRKCIELEVDGEVKELPYELNLEELKSMSALGADVEASAFLDWFVGFMRPYVGDCVDGFGDMAISAVIAEWNTARGVSMGEPSA